MSTITLDSLSAEERKKLIAEAQAEFDNKKSKVSENRKAYKKMVNETIPGIFIRLVNVSRELEKVKAETFNDLKTLIEFKQEAYGKDGDQYSHSFTTDEGITIIVGNRVTDNWDDTVTSGLNKIDKVLKSLAKDRDSQMLIGVIKKLLAKDAKGNLKSSRVISLKKEAEASGNLEFIDAINIIMDAYKPVKSREFVTVRYKDDRGEIIDLPLDITAAGFAGEKEAENG